MSNVFHAHQEQVYVAVAWQYFSPQEQENMSMIPLLEL
jgi:hypothetical protein